MSGLLGKYTKQSSETLDWDVDFTDWFSNRTDTPASFTVVSDVAGLTVNGTLNGNIVKVTVSGGANGGKYKITVKLTTGNALVKEIDFQIAIKDI